MTDLVKIQFDLEPDEDGYPPVGSESLNASDTGDGSFILENTPFFVEEVALQDRVRAVPIEGAKNRFRFVEVIAESGYKALSIIFIESTDRERDELLAKFQAWGCYCETGNYGALAMLAAAIPESQDYRTISAHLDKLEAADVLSYAELAL